MYVYASTSHGEVIVVTKKLTYVLLVVTVIVLIACFVLTAGCLDTKEAPAKKMFINGTVDDVRYSPVGYSNFATYQVLFRDGRWTVIGIGSVGGVPGIDKSVSNINLIEKVRIGSNCSMLFEKRAYWDLISVETD